MSGLDSAHQKGLAHALRSVPGMGHGLVHRDDVSDALAPLIARWLADARAEGAANALADTTDHQNRNNR